MSSDLVLEFPHANLKNSCKLSVFDVFFVFIHIFFQPNDVFSPLLQVVTNKTKKTQMEIGQQFKLGFNII